MGAIIIPQSGVLKALRDIVDAISVGCEHSMNTSTTEMLHGRLSEINGS